SLISMHTTESILSGATAGSLILVCDSATEDSSGLPASASRWALTTSSLAGKSRTPSAGHWNTWIKILLPLVVQRQPHPELVSRCLPRPSLVLAAVPYSAPKQLGPAP